MDQETSYYNIPDENSRYRSSSNSMAAAASVMGIVSAAATFILPVYLPCVLGSIAIVLALLSRGSGHMSFRAKMGMVVALISIISNIAMLIAGVYMLITVPELRMEFEKLLEAMELNGY